MRALTTLIYMLLAALLASQAVADTELRKRFTDDELVEILKQDGYGAVGILKPGIVRVKINGRSYLLLNNNDGDLQTVYIIGGVELTSDDINEWNRGKRLSRAYLDDDNDPVLESDLLANAGMTPEHVTEFFRVFVGSVDAFRDFVIQHDRG